MVGEAVLPLQNVHRASHHLASIHTIRISHRAARVDNRAAERVGRDGKAGMLRFLKLRTRCRNDWRSSSDEKSERRSEPSATSTCHTQAFQRVRAGLTKGSG